MSDWLGGMQTTPRKTPKNVCEAAILFARIKMSSQRTNEEITFVKAAMATPNKSAEWWSDDDVSALLEIYSDRIQKLLLKAVSVVQQKVSQPGNRPQRKVMPGRRR